MSRECDALAVHLTGRPCPPPVAQRYEAALRDLGLDLSPGERSLWNACVRWQPLLACLDAGVALWHRNGAIRRRLLVMFALLEACPEDADLFLFSRPTVLASVSVVWHGMVAVAAAIAGTPLGLLSRAAAPGRTG